MKVFFTLLGSPAFSWPGYALLCLKSEVCADLEREFYPSKSWSSCSSRDV